MDFSSLAQGAQQLDQKKLLAQAPVSQSPSQAVAQGSPGAAPPSGGPQVPGGQDQGQGGYQTLGGGDHEYHGAHDPTEQVPGSYLQFDSVPAVSQASTPMQSTNATMATGSSGGWASDMAASVDPNYDTRGGPWGAAWFAPGTEHSAIQSADRRDLEQAMNEGIYASGTDVPGDSPMGWLDDYINGIQGAEHDWQSSVDQNAAMRDAALRHMYEQMASRGMGASGASAGMAGDIYQSASRDLACEWEQLRQTKQQEMMGLGDLLWKDRWKELDQMQQERMAQWMFDHQKEMADFLEAIKQARPGQVEDMLSQLYNSIAGLFS